MQRIPKNLYEGAGFILFDPFEHNFILGVSSNTGDLEYIGGKPESNETPQQTAFNELVEEIGGNPLDIDWETRVQVLYFFNYSQKWIWCFFISLSFNEIQKLHQLAKQLNSWPVELEKDFSSITGRTELAKKEITSIVSVNIHDFFNYIEIFTKWPRTRNRRLDAVRYGTHNSTKLIVGKNLCDNNYIEPKKIREFNCVIFEQHLEWLKNAVNVNK